MQGNGGEGQRRETREKMQNTTLFINVPIVPLSRSK